MKIKGIIHCQRGYAKLYSTSAVSMDKMRSELLTKGIVYLYLSINDKNHSINFTNMCRDSALLVACEDWEEVTSIVEIIGVTDYIDEEIPVPSYITVDQSIREIASTRHGLSLLGENQLNIIPANVSTSVTIGYGNTSKPYLNNKYYARGITPDMTFTFKKGSTVNLNNVIPICNGYTCFPVVKDNVLYGTNGAQLCRNLNERNSGNILIDFSAAGSLECVKLGDCTGTVDRFTLPTGKTMKHKFVMLVLDGHLFTPGEFDRLSSRVVHFDKSKFTPMMMMDKHQCWYDFNYNTGIIAKQDSFDLMKSANSFLIMIDAPLTIAYHEPIMQVDANVWKFPGYVGGLALDLSTKTIIDYSRVQYGGSSYFLQETDPYIASHHKDLKSDRYSMIYLNRQDWVKPIQRDNNYMCEHGITYSSRNNLDIYNHSIEHRIILLDFMFK